MKTLILGLLLACLAARGAQNSEPPTPPNILFILADDLGYGDLGCYGQKRIATPRLDRMATEGMRFTRFYAGSTVCAPSRSTLMQGLHTGHCRVRGNAGKANPLAQALRPDDRTVASLLQQAGYATGLFGKWGLGDAGAAEVGLPRKHGFSEFFGYLNQHHAHNYFPTFLWQNEERVTLPNVVPKEDAAGGGRASVRKTYSPDLILSHALDFLRLNRSKPFFLCFTTTLPHANNEAGTNGMEIPNLGPYADRDWPPAQKAHAAMVTRLDQDVGRLLDLVDELGLRERTLVLFSSDNGPHREGGNDPHFNDSNGPFRGIKRDLYEGGIRVPFLARWPGHVPAGTVTDEVGWFPDFMPTAAALAGIASPSPTDGINLVPVLTGQAKPSEHPPLYWEFHEGGFKQAVCVGDWKAVRLNPGKPVELYNLRLDPGESHNLAAQHPEEVTRMERLLTNLRHESQDWPVR